MKKLALAMLLALAGISANAFAQDYPANGYIGVFGDAAGTNCCITSTGGATTLHVIAVTGGASSGGFTGAEFRIEVAPAQPGAFLVWTASPSANVVIGNPIDNSDGPNDTSGINMAFSTCQKQLGQAGDHITLGTIVVFGLTGEREIRVKKHNKPSNPAFMAPLLVLCDGPTFTKVPLTKLEGDPWLQGHEPMSFRTPVNAPGCSGATCGFVGVEQSTWSGMKGLYR